MFSKVHGPLFSEDRILFLLSYDAAISCLSTGWTVHMLVYLRRKELAFFQVLAYECNFGKEISKFRDASKIALDTFSSL